eukprot:CAMPEP_0118906592 /NCGR_PEP_ID=MMETSP1166-20130328/10296_1 /TAXON_ID=1104430 /ORGANISM="Chrysoreinhardia sp, Strain CCMP3193" /LENGTH=522 /DNA_ID=CAMNT_0006845915 /DNA_START=101 /DNA_END=1666 /DNA_ORIENTATION=-
MSSSAGEKELLEQASSFDALAEEAMGAMGRGEFREAVGLFDKALRVDAKFEGSEISSERADVAYDLGCCFAQLRDFEKARQWLRRAVLWGVRDVDPSVDEHLAPMRNAADWSDVLESFLPPTERVPAAVLVRSRRQNAGRNMDALKKLVDEEEDDDDDGGSFEEDDDEAEDQRDVFDSDFDESESDDDDDEDEDGEDDDAARKKKKKRKTDDGGHAQKKKKTDQKTSLGGGKAQQQQKSRRAAARTAREINAAEVANGDARDSDDSDDDFEDAAAAADVAPSARDTFAEISATAEAERRKRKVDTAFLDMNDDDDVADDLSPPPPSTQKKKAAAKEEEATDHAVLRAAGGTPAAERRRGADGDLRADDALKIIARARRAREKRRAEPTMSAKEAADLAVTTRDVVLTRTFAGEKIELTQTVDASTTAHAQQPKAGIDAVIDELKGPKAVTAVAKSAYDWDSFKQKEGLEDSLRDASRKGYLNNQDFLQRVDVRQFEKERDQRERLRNEANAAGGAGGGQPPS